MDNYVHLKQTEINNLLTINTFFFIMEHFISKVK